MCANSMAHHYSHTTRSSGAYTYKNGQEQKVNAERALGKQELTHTHTFFALPIYTPLNAVRRCRAVVRGLQWVIQIPEQWVKILNRSAGTIMALLTPFTKFLCPIKANFHAHLSHSTLEENFLVRGPPLQDKYSIPVILPKWVPIAAL